MSKELKSLPNTNQLPNPTNDEIGALTITLHPHNAVIIGGVVEFKLADVNRKGFPQNKQVRITILAPKSVTIKRVDKFR